MSDDRMNTNREPPISTRQPMKLTPVQFGKKDPELARGLCNLVLDMMEPSEQTRFLGGKSTKSRAMPWVGILILCVVVVFAAGISKGTAGSSVAPQGVKYVDLDPPRQ